MAIQIYTDGSSRGNPGPGGFAAILMYKNHRKEISGAYRLTTNNRMELMAVIVGLEAIKNKSLPVVVYSDSKYVVDAVTKGWLNQWFSKQFKGKKNKDLWMRYHRIAKELNITFQWVKGHANNPFNNRCDELATYAADNGPFLEDTGYQPEEA